MNSRLILVMVGVLMLAGCGGGDKQAPTELSGKLQGGHLQGVEWRTPTRSGTTDANGGFAYLPGETVTFSLGAVELGAVPGSPDITLFTLAGLTPPTTERTLRRELDRAMRTSTPFTRAVNLDLLLIALDADGNPDNGVDVRNRDDSLRGVSLDFDQGIIDFGQQLFTTVPSLAQSVPMFKPVAHLYSSLGLRIPAHAQTRILNEDSFRPQPGVQTFDYLPDGSLRSEDEDQDGDGVIDAHTGYEYDGFGRLTRLEGRVDFDLDHVDDQSFTSTYEYGARGRILREEQTTVQPRFGPTQTWRLVENDVDEFGRTTRSVVDIDTDGDGVIDSRQTGTAQYDASRRGGVFITTTDDGLDGVNDRVARSTERRDARGRLLSLVSELDADADGVVDSRYTDSYVYDDLARTVREVTEDDRDADGTADWRAVHVYQRDRAGNLVAQTASTEPQADGVVSQAQTVVREFDGDRRVTRTSRDDDLNGDGLPDSSQSEEVVYDDLGNVTWRTSDFDADHDGHVDSHVDEGSEYGPDGELLATATHYDLNGDGFTDFRTGSTVESTLRDDGVLLLTYWYFRNRFSGVQ